MAGRVAQKIGLAEFSKGNEHDITSQSHNSEAEKKKKATEMLKFKVKGFGPSLETQQESSQEHLAEPTITANRSGPSQGNRAMTTGGVVDLDGANRSLSNARNSANVTRRRDESNAPTFTRRDQADDEYPLSSDGEETNDEPSGLPVDRQVFENNVDQLLKSSYNAIIQATADRRRRQNAIETPNSYPESSEGRSSQVQRSPPRSQSRISRIDMPDHWSISHAINFNRNRRSSQVGKTPQQNEAGNLEEYGAKYMATQAQNYHKTHAHGHTVEIHTRQTPQRKPLQASALVRANSDSGNARGQRRELHTGNAFDALELSEHHARGSRFPSAPPAGHDFSFQAPHTAPQELEIANDYDYELPALYDKPFSDLTSEPFDHDPRKPLEANLTSNSIRAQLERLLESVDEDQKCQFFEGLSLKEWEQAGEWIPEQFAALRKGMADKRQERRDIAQRFEREVARREKVVRKDTEEVHAQLKEMKNSGGKVLEVRGSKRPRS